MKQLIEDLFKFNRYLLGSGYDNALEYLKHLIGLEVIEVPSGERLGTWEVPRAWEVKDAWLKYEGKKLLDYKKNPLCLVVGSLPFKGKVSYKTLVKHLYTSDEKPEAYPYEYAFYEKDWGLCIPRSEVKKLKKKGKYEVMIDTKEFDSTLKIGVHTIKGKTDREVLLFAHLDHPYQANDNLSGVACLVGLAKKLKCQHTIKIIFCPETIGSIAYAFKRDISKVDFVIAVDMVGNDETLLIQKTFRQNSDLDCASHLALTGLGINFRKGHFRMLIGSDEYVFNDPAIDIPAIMVSRWSEEWKDYHTSDDTPDKIKMGKIREAQRFIQKVIEITENDFIPVRNFKGPLFRSKFQAQSVDKRFNRNLDYLFYLMNGKRSLSLLCCLAGVPWDFAFNLLNKLKNENLVSYLSKEKFYKAAP